MLGLSQRRLALSLGVNPGTLQSWEAGQHKLEYHSTTSQAAELCKYMENCFLATKVGFVNQFYDIAQVIGVDFDELRRLWLLDSRIKPSHTRMEPTRGFGGKCLPKDWAPIVGWMRPFGGAPLLEALLAYNISLE